VNIFLKLKQIGALVVIPCLGQDPVEGKIYDLNFWKNLEEN